MNLTKNKVLITGGAKGIGWALAKKFHASGNHVVLVGRDAFALDAAATLLPGASTCLADVSDPDDRLRLFRSYPDVNVLINNAGIQLTGQFAQMSTTDIQRELNTNLIGPVMLTHLFLPNLQCFPSAAIVNVSSVLGLIPKQSACIYSASKAALHSFTQSLRWQLESSNVRVFEIVPPLVDTAMTSGSHQKKLSPEALADEFWHHFSANKQDAYIDKANAARLLARLLPSVAERLIRHS